MNKAFVSILECVIVENEGQLCPGISSMPFISEEIIHSCLDLVNEFITPEIDSNLANYIYESKVKLMCVGMNENGLKFEVFNENEILNDNKEFSNKLLLIRKDIESLLNVITVDLFDKQE